jgi:hypothetical protein
VINLSISVINMSTLCSPSAVPSFSPRFSPFRRTPRDNKHSPLFLPALVPIPMHSARIDNKKSSTMMECDHDRSPAVIDLLCSSSSDDDCSFSTIDPYYDSFELGIEEHGTIFVRDKAIKTASKDASTKTTNTTFHSIYETDASYSSSISLTDYPWYLERAVRPSKKRRDLSVRRYVFSCRRHHRSQVSSKHRSIVLASLLFKKFHPTNPFISLFLRWPGTQFKFVAVQLQFAGSMYVVISLYVGLVGCRRPE